MNHPNTSSSVSGPFHFKHPLVLRTTAQHREAGRQKGLFAFIEPDL